MPTNSGDTFKLLFEVEDNGVGIPINEQERHELFVANPGIYDLIFMDIHIPEMDGFEATEKIREVRL